VATRLGFIWEQNTRFSADTTLVPQKLMMFASEAGFSDDKLIKGAALQSGLAW